MASAGAVDSQRVPGAATVGKGSRGWDAGKKATCRRRHLVVDTMGLLIVVLVTAAGVRDRDGAVRVLDRAKMVMPSLVLVWADAAYSRRTSEFAARALRIGVQVMAKLAGYTGTPGMRLGAAHRFLACLCERHTMRTLSSAA